MINKFKEEIGHMLVGTIFAWIFLFIESIFRLKSKGLLKTEEEWFGLVAIFLELLPMFLTSMIVITFVIVATIHFVEKIYKYFVK